MEWIYIVLPAVAVLPFIGMWVMYRKTGALLGRLERMLDAAVDGTFSEQHFSEDGLSRLEAKLYRCLHSEGIIRSRLLLQKEAAEALVSNISHQTKTPLANILLYSQLLKERELGREERELSEQIEWQAEKLDFLVQSLVKLSRLESGTIAPVPSYRRAGELLSRLSVPALAKEKGVEVRIREAEADMAAFFDCKWTEEALNNIVDNAVKYTPQGGEVEVSASEYEMFVRIDVKDTGIGITEEDTARIFLRFYRAHAAKDEKGVGLGLYLAREIIGKEGGYIRVSSEPGKGSVFSVFLPKQPIVSEL